MTKILVAEKFFCVLRIQYGGIYFYHYFHFRPHTFIIGINAYNDLTAGTGIGTQFTIHVTSKSMY